MARGSGTKEEFLTKLKTAAHPEEKVTQLQVARDSGEFFPVQLTKELALKTSKDELLLVTWSNYALLDFVLNWVSHAVDNGMDNYLVGAMDERLARDLHARGIQFFVMYDANETHTGLGHDHLAWGSESFHKMGRQKITLAKTFMDMGVSILLIDADFVLLRNVVDYVNRYPEANLLVSSDHLMSTLEPGDDGLELVERAQSPMNIGLMLFRYSPEMQKFVSEWLDMILKDDKYWDQNAFNDLARRGWDPHSRRHPQNTRLARGWDGNIYFGVLPVSTFGSGHTFFVQRMYEVQKLQPYAVHATYQFGGNRGKRHRMREAMIFKDPPEYYTLEKYVSFNLSHMAVPPDFEQLDNDAMKRFDREQTMHQVHQLHKAVALAVALQRTLILPPLRCFCDRIWFGVEKCRAAGASQMRLPYVCPLDHVINPSHFDDGAAEVKVSMREYSLLDNPRCPQTIKQSVIYVKSSPDVSAPRTEKGPHNRPRVLLPANLAQPVLTQHLSSHADVAVLHFEEVGAVMTHLENPQQEQQLQQRLQHFEPWMVTRRS